MLLMGSEALGAEGRLARGERAAGTGHGQPARGPSWITLLDKFVRFCQEK